MGNNTKIVLDIIAAGINAVKPKTLFNNHVTFDGKVLTVFDKKYNLSNIDDLYIVGFGKASAAMALEAENLLYDIISDGAVVTNYGSGVQCRKIKIYEAGHPIVNQDSLTASKEIVDLCKKGDKNDFIICLVSGGGSALFEQLPVGINLNDLQELNKLLIKCGAEINEINIVRKQVSLVKGGKLLDYILPAKCISLIISDVPGDEIASIASGPLIKENSSALEAIDILQKYNLTDQIPVNIRDYLMNRINTDDTEDEDHYSFNVENIILGCNRTAKESAKEAAEKFGLNTYMINRCISGEAADAGKYFAEVINTLQINGVPLRLPACIIAGGETTVIVKGSGKGGRNQELALSVLANADKNTDYVFASCGTDGIDSINEAAGGIVSNSMWPKIEEFGIDPAMYLHSNDSFNFLRQIAGIIPGKPTFTNVMDLIVCIIA